jgi:hypothetical protein
LVDPCRWHTDPSVPEGRFLIPGCWNRVVHGDEAECHCPKPPKRMPKKAQPLIEALAELNLDDEQLDNAWDYLRRMKSYKKN